MSLNLTKTVTAFLAERPDQKFTARQIAEWVFENFPEECQDKKDRSLSLGSDDELLQQLVREITAQHSRILKKNPSLRTTEGRPRKYYSTEKSEQDEINEAESSFETEGTGRVLEHDLYPFLLDYLGTELEVFSKRIDEKRSSNRHGPKGNKWLYPDVVGMKDLSADWDRGIKDCVASYSGSRTSLWSFEVKLLVNRSNVRESYFQAVSNSSWANFGYLVAGEVEGNSTVKELRILSAAHGIGLIQLDLEAPAESQIIIPARERPDIDWDTCNRLAVENKDFSQFVKLVREFYQTGGTKMADWDLPPTLE